MRVAVLLLFFLIHFPVPASARSVPCLAADPLAADDAEALSAIREQVDAQCPCASFTGAKGSTRADYMKCARVVLKSAVDDGRLRKQCKATATYPAARSICGYRPEAAKLPCVQTSRSGKVSCKVAPASSCERAHGTSCATYENCLDAADTNHDYRVGAGDAGACNPAVACLNPPAPDGVACDDGDACTQNDTCSGHACVGTPYSCSPGACQESATCNGDGTCSFAARADGTTCDAGTDEARTRICTNATCSPCTPAGICSVDGRACAFDVQCPGGETCSFASAPSPRFVDNGDGTITDRHTCLVWEKKGAYDGAPVACPGGATCGDPHDADNVYSWSSTDGRPDGAVFTDFLATLNAATFAGHADWRLPRTAFPPELEGIADATAAGCGSGAPCAPAEFSTACTPTCSGADPACSCTGAFPYWSASAGTFVDFADGSSGTTTATSSEAARAVRGCIQSPVLPSIKSACVGDCSLGCGVVGSCIFGCELGQVNSVDQCYVECGPDDVCLDACLATVQCIAEGSAQFCP